MSSTLPENAECFDVEKYNTGNYDLYFRNGQKCDWYFSIHPKEISYPISWWKNKQHTKFECTTTRKGRWTVARKTNQDIFIVPKINSPTSTFHDSLLCHNTLL